MEQKINKRIEIVKETIDIISEPNLVAFMKGELLGLEIALGIIEREKANENKKV